MDDYDAQMAAMLSAATTDEATSEQPSSVVDEIAAEMLDSSRTSSNNKWSGQNRYTQQLLSESQPPLQFHDYSKYYETATTVTTQQQHEEEHDQQSYVEQSMTASAATAQPEQTESFTATAAASTEEEEDAYNADYTNHLLNLQAELEQTEAEADLDEMGDKFLELVSNEVQYKELLMSNDGDGSVDGNGETGGQSDQPLWSPPSANNENHAAAAANNSANSANNNDQSSSSSPPTEDQYLAMLSSEITYKKLLNQSPYSIVDIEFPVLLQRALDNLEDGTQKNNGKFKGQSKLRRERLPKEERKTVVVLGTGWASHAFVKLASTYDLRIVVVSPVNHFVFTPMLASAAVGTVEYRSMTEPIRVTNPYIDNFVEGRAIGVDVENKKVAVQLTALGTVTGAFKGVASSAPCRLDPEPVQTSILFEEDGTIVRDKRMGAGDVIELNYDHLLCCVGTASRSSIVPGAKEHCFNLKTSQDSKRLRTAIGEALEFASRPDVQEFYYASEDDRERARAERRRRLRIAVVGGGPTGVELSGELCDFFGQICGAPDGAYQHLREDVEVLLIHGGAELLPAMDRELRLRALEALQGQGVKVYLNTRLKEVGQDYIIVGEKGSDAVEEIPLAVTVWAAGNAPVPFIKELLSQLPPEAAGSGGRIMVDRWLRPPTYTKESFGSIMVLGDVACFESQSKFDTEPQALPQTAQVAGQQGAFAARMLNRGYDTDVTPPKLHAPSSTEAFSLLRVWLIARGLEEAPGFNFLSLGLLAYVGQEEALNQVMLGNVPLFNYSGKFAFVLWRSVYLAKQASSRNQALIAFDWLRTEAFGRDITRL